MTEFDLIKPDRAVSYQMAYRPMRLAAALQAPLKEPRRNNSCKDYGPKWAISPRRGRKGLITGLLLMGSRAKAVGAVSL